MVVLALWLNGYVQLVCHRLAFGLTSGEVLQCPGATIL
jgi:hypothetical protein